MLPGTLALVPAADLAAVIVPFLFKLLGAIALWIVGGWLINFALRLLRRMLNQGTLDPTLISYLSHITTLVTGDIIFTGTPDGIGAARGAFLADGDVITTTIDGIGTMTNRCVRASNYRNEDS
jgi:small conductance mechanosensitive channel